MAKTFFGTATQHPTPQSNKTLDCDYEQLRKDAVALTRKTTELLVRLHNVKDGDTDPRIEALVHAEKCLVDADFHLREGGHLAHLDDDL